MLHTLTVYKNVMAATYPDMFAAGIAYAGVPAGCFKSAADIPAEWNSTCATGKSIYTQQQWANVVKDAYPGYSGPRPKIQIYHGSVDEVLNVQNYYETIKQWTGVFGYSTTATSTTPNFPRSPYTKYVFGDKFQVGCTGTLKFLDELIDISTGFPWLWCHSFNRRVSRRRPQMVRFPGKG